MSPKAPSFRGLNCRRSPTLSAHPWGNRRASKSAAMAPFCPICHAGAARAKMLSPRRSFPAVSTCLLAQRTACKSLHPSWDPCKVASIAPLASPTGASLNVENPADHASDPGPGAMAKLKINGHGGQTNSTRLPVRRDLGGVIGVELGAWRPALGSRSPAWTRAAGWRDRPALSLRDPSQSMIGRCSQRLSWACGPHRDSRNRSATRPRRPYESAACRHGWRSAHGPIRIRSMAVGSRFAFAGGLGAFQPGSEAQVPLIRLSPVSGLLSGTARPGE